MSIYNVWALHCASCHQDLHLRPPWRPTWRWRPVPRTCGCVVDSPLVHFARKADAPRVCRLQILEVRVPASWAQPWQEFVLEEVNFFSLCSVKDLRSKCLPDFTLTPLEEGFIYRGPSVANANRCRCSSVYYSMLSACAYCQGRNYIR
jgi:hypothetical protein